MEEKMIKPIGEIIRSQYVIPLYQRNFAWGDAEIKQLVTDLYRSKKHNQPAYFIGSLITLKRGETEYEVIDGQQRLTAVSLLLKYLLPKNEEILSPYLFYDSRKEVQNFLKKYHENTNEYNKDAKWLVDLNNDSVVDFIKGLDSIDNAPLDIKSKIFLNSLCPEDKAEFGNYILEHVMLVHVIMPDETDVASYFEIMNNRGAQLQSHEVIKSRLMEKIANEAGEDKELAKRNRTIFATIWDACSEMNHKVQRNITGKDIREALFGGEYRELHLENISILGEHATEGRDGLTISEIIDSKNIKSIIPDDDDNDDDSDSNIEQSVVDFQNFLLQVFKVLYDKKYIDIEGADSNNEDDNGVQLHEKYLISTYDTLCDVIRPMEFIKELLKFRVIFDRYVVKVNDTKQNDGTRLEDEPKWILHVAKKRESVKGRSKSFSVGHEDTFSRTPEQEYIVKALSMLQVTYRQRRYKNYLTEILRWFSDGNLNHTGKWYLDKLNGYILNILEKDDYYKTLRENEKFESLNAIADGTKTPHFLLNFIDYLYWTAWKKKMHSSIPELAYLDSYSTKDFVFKYSNSIEHHCPQSAVENAGDQWDWSHVDSLGNLCLVSKSANSKLGNEDPKGKASVGHWYYKPDLSPMRKIMYDITNEQDWTQAKIEERYNDIVKLISYRSEILGKADIDPMSPEIIRAMLCTTNMMVEDYWSGDRYFRRTIIFNPENVRQAIKQISNWIQENPSLDIEDYISCQLSNNESLRNNPWLYLFIKYPRMYEICQESRRVWFDKEQPNTVILLKGERWSSSNFCDLMTIAVEQELVNNGVRTSSLTNDYTNFIRIYTGGVSLLVYHEEDMWYYYLEATREDNMNLIKVLNNHGWMRIGTGQYQIKEREKLIDTCKEGMLEEVKEVTKAILEIKDIVDLLSLSIS